jgi:hypothetical protein
MARWCRFERMAVRVLEFFVQGKVMVVSGKEDRE